MIIRKTIIHLDGRKEVLPEKTLPEDNRFGMFLTPWEHEYDMSIKRSRQLAPLTFRGVDGEELTAPIGFINDGFSIPLIKGMFGDIDGKYGAAAALHDFGYSVQKLARAVYDGILRSAMRVLKASWALTQFIWVNVRTFGGIAWKIDASEAAEAAEHIRQIGQLPRTVAPRPNAMPIYRNPHQTVLQLRWREKYAA